MFTSPNLTFDGNKKLSQLLSGNDMRDGEGWKPEVPVF